MTPAELYSTLYKTQRYGDGPISQARSDLFFQVVREHVPRGASILEIGCGRGRLMRLLIEAGYHCQGTEIADVLFETDLADLPVTKMDCAQLHVFADASFDCVASNDVLEHLPNESAVVAAVDNMIRISRRWVIVSVGTKSSSFPIDDPEIKTQLHTVLREPDWWETIFRERIRIAKRVMLLVGSLLVVCAKGGEPEEETGVKRSMRWQF
jgi:SAM-dependent methyltransferase